MTAFDREIISSISFFQQYWFVFAIGGAVLVIIIYILARRRLNYVSRYNRRIRHPNYAIRFWHCCCCGPKLAPGENPFHSDSESEEDEDDLPFEDLTDEDDEDDEYHEFDDADGEDDVDTFEDARDFDDVRLNKRINHHQHNRKRRSSTGKYATSGDDADEE